MQFIALVFKFKLTFWRIERNEFKDGSKRCSFEISKESCEENVKKIRELLLKNIFEGIFANAVLFFYFPFSSTWSYYYQTDYNVKPKSRMSQEKEKEWASNKNIIRIFWLKF